MSSSPGISLRDIHLSGDDNRLLPGATLDVSDGAIVGTITGSGLTMSTGKLLGRFDPATGVIQLITIGANINLSAAGVLSSSTGGGASDLRDIWIFS